MLIDIILTWVANSLQNKQMNFELFNLRSDSISDSSRSRSISKQLTEIIGVPEHLIHLPTNQRLVLDMIDQSELTLVLIAPESS